MSLSYDFTQMGRVDINAPRWFCMMARYLHIEDEETREGCLKQSRQMWSKERQEKIRK